MHAHYEKKNAQKKFESFKSLKFKIERKLNLNYKM